MRFAEFLNLKEQGTVGGPMGGPGASGRLGENPMKPAQITPKLTDIAPASSFSSTGKSVKPLPGGKISLGLKVPRPTVTSPMSPGTVNLNNPPPSPMSGNFKQR